MIYTHNMKIKKSNLILFTWTVIFRLTLELSYIFLMQPLFKSDGFIVNIHPVKIVLSWFAFLVMNFFISSILTKDGIRASSVVIYLLFLVSYVPLCSFYSLMGISNIFFILLSVYWGLILFLEVNLSKINIKVLSINYTENGLLSFFILEAITIIFCIFVFFSSLFYNGLFINISFDNIYELRKQAAFGGFGTLSGYLFTWAGGIVIPFASIRCWKKKNWVYFSILCFIQLLLFSINGSKAVLLIIPVAVTAYVFYSDKKLFLIPLLLTGINLCAIFEFLILKTYRILSVFQYRTLFIPAQLNYYFYDFFTKNPPDMLHQSIFRWFGAKSQYKVSIPYMIWVEYYNKGNYSGDTWITANTGMFGDAYSNFGVMSIFLYPILFVSVLSLLNYATKGIDRKIYIVIIITLVINLTNISFFTSLLTGGYFVAIILLSLYKECKVNIRFKNIPLQMKQKYGDYLCKKLAG